MKTTCLLLLLLFTSCSRSIEEVQIEQKIKEVQSLTIGDTWQLQEVYIKEDMATFFEIEKTYVDKYTTSYTVKYEMSCSCKYKQITFVVNNKSYAIETIKFNY